MYKANPAPLASTGSLLKTTNVSESVEMISFTRKLMFGVQRVNSVLIVVIHNHQLETNVRKDATIHRYGIGRVRIVPAALTTKPLSTTPV